MFARSAVADINAGESIHRIRIFTWSVFIYIESLNVCYFITCYVQLIINIPEGKVFKTMLMNKCLH